MSMVTRMIKYHEDATLNATNVRTLPLTPTRAHTGVETVQPRAFLFVRSCTARLARLLFNPFLFLLVLFLLLSCFSLFFFNAVKRLLKTRSARN